MIRRVSIHRNWKGTTTAHRGRREYVSVRLRVRERVRVRGRGSGSGRGRGREQGGERERRERGGERGSEGARERGRAGERERGRGREGERERVKDVSEGEKSEKTQRLRHDEKGTGRGRGRGRGVSSPGMHAGKSGSVPQEQHKGLPWLEPVGRPSQGRLPERCCRTCGHERAHITHQHPLRSIPITVAARVSDCTIYGTHRHRAGQQYINSGHQHITDEAGTFQEAARHLRDALLPIHSTMQGYEKRSHVPLLRCEIARCNYRNDII